MKQGGGRGGCESEVTSRREALGGGRSRGGVTYGGHGLKGGRETFLRSGPSKARAQASAEGEGVSGSGLAGCEGRRRQAPEARLSWGRVRFLQGET